MVNRQRLYRVVFTRAAQIVLGVYVAPDPLHVRPVGHDAVLNGVGEAQCPSVLICLASNESACHDKSATMISQGMCGCGRRLSGHTYISLPSKEPPAITRRCFVRPTYERNTTRGLSTPAKPAFSTPEHNVGG